MYLQGCEKGLGFFNFQAILIKWSKTHCTGLSTEQQEYFFFEKMKAMQKLQLCNDFA